MRPAFDTTLEYFCVQDGRPVATEGPQVLGKIGEQELRALFETFRELDPTQNFQGEPSISVRYRGARFSILTSQRRLLLYDLNKRDQPALSLEPEELLAELDGSAAEARAAQLRATYAPFPLEEEPAYVPPPTQPRKFPGVLSALTAAAVLCTTLLFALTDSAKAPLKAIPLEDSAAIALKRKAVAGVYLTGQNQGDHGLVLNEDGSLKLFHIFAELPPGLIFDEYQPALIEGHPCLVTTQPGGIIRIIDGDTLVYSDETYTRVR